MKRIVLAFALLCAAAATAQAEPRWALELRAGAGPSNQIGETDLGTGVGFEGVLEYRLMPHLSGYGGWDWHQFSPEQSFAGTEMDFEETGYAFGLRLQFPFPGGDPAWWIRAGGTVNHIEVENDSGDIVADSEHGLGWEAAAGVTVPITERWSLTPGARYRALSRDVTVAGTTSNVDLGYVMFEMGISRSF